MGGNGCVTVISCLAPFPVTIDLPPGCSSQPQPRDISSQSFWMVGPFERDFPFGWSAADLWICGSAANKMTGGEGDDRRQMRRSAIEQGLRQMRWSAPKTPFALYNSAAPRPLAVCRTVQQAGCHLGDKSSSYKHFCHVLSSVKAFGFADIILFRTSQNNSKRIGSSQIFQKPYYSLITTQKRFYSVCGRRHTPTRGLHR